jgi:hypothetical protein
VRAAIADNGAHGVTRPTIIRGGNAYMRTAADQAIRSRRARKPQRSDHKKSEAEASLAE